MSTRLVFEDSKVDYLLPSAQGANVGEVIAVTSAVGGLTLGFQAGGGGGGLTQEDVYGQGDVYAIPVIANATNGQIFTAQNGQCVLTSSAPLTESQVYGQGNNSYVLPVLATATNGQIAKKVGADLTFADAPAPSLTQQQVYGQGAPYVLAPLGNNGQIMSVQGGQTTFVEYSGLQAEQLWANGPNYMLPNLTGAAPGAALTSNGANALAFTLNSGRVLGVTLYGGTSVTNPNPPYALPTIASGGNGDALTRQGGNATWVAQAPGVTSADLWENPAVQLKIPDYTGSQPNTMYAVETGNVPAWNAPPESITAAQLWAVPAPSVQDNYKLPVQGAQGTVLTVSATPNTLVYQNATIEGTTSVTATFASQFPGQASTPQTIVFSKTGKLVTCAITSSDPIDTGGATGADLLTVTFVPDSLPAISAYLPPTNTPNVLDLGAMPLTEVTLGITVTGMLRINPSTGAITWTSYDDPPLAGESYYPAAIEAGSVFVGTWVTA